MRLRAALGTDYASRKRRLLEELVALAPKLESTTDKNNGSRMVPERERDVTFEQIAVALETLQELGFLDGPAELAHWAGLLLDEPERRLGEAQQMSAQDTTNPQRADASVTPDGASAFETTQVEMLRQAVLDQLATERAELQTLLKQVATAERARAEEAEATQEKRVSELTTLTIRRLQQRTL